MERLHHLCSKGHPNTSKEAMNSFEAPFSKEAINNEIKSVIKNSTWIMTSLPLCCKTIGYEWYLGRN